MFVGTLRFPCPNFHDFSLPVMTVGFQSLEKRSHLGCSFLDEYTRANCVTKVLRHPDCGRSCKLCPMYSMIPPKAYIDWRIPQCTKPVRLTNRTSRHFRWSMSLCGHFATHVSQLQMRCNAVSSRVTTREGVHCAAAENICWIQERTWHWNMKSIAWLIKAYNKQKGEHDSESVEWSREASWKRKNEGKPTTNLLVISNVQFSLWNRATCWSTKECRRIKTICDFSHQIWIFVVAFGDTRPHLKL